MDRWGSKGTAVVRRFGVLVVAGLILVACGSDAEGPSAESTTRSTAADGRGVAMFDGDHAYSFSTFEEIRTFTDAWVAVEVTAERLGDNEGDGDREGYQPRWVTVTVTDTLWQRPDVTVPESFEVETALVVSEYRASHFVGVGGVPLVVGESYVLGLIRDAEGNLGVAHQSAVLPREGATVQRPIPFGSDEPPSTMTAEAFVAEVAAATPEVPDTVTDFDARVRASFDVDGEPTTTTGTTPP